MTRKPTVLVKVSLGLGLFLVLLLMIGSLFTKWGPPIIAVFFIPWACFLEGFIYIMKHNEYLEHIENG